MRITVFTGSGISKESGLDTFRDVGGIWDQYDPHEVCSARGLSKNRQAVLDFHNKLRAKVDEVEPNEAHRAIVELEKYFDVNIVTQNVDDLHERAGSSNVLKVHGDIYTARLKRYKDPFIEWRQDITLDSHPEGWERCKGTMRPDVVLFGESVHKGRKALQLMNNCRYLIVCGTSLSVNPAADWVRKSSAPYKILVDKSATTIAAETSQQDEWLVCLSGTSETASFTEVIEQPASTGMRQAVDLILRKEGFKDE